MIVLTGAAGFIGSCILARLNELGREDIIIVDHIEEDDIKRENLKDKRYADYLDKTDFLELVKKDELTDLVKNVIHMGACSSTTLEDAAYFRENNFEYSCQLARWCLLHKTRFIYASSAATYGDGSHGYSDDDRVTRRLKPLNLYGESKHSFDLWVLGNGVVDKMAGLKFFNVFGPNEYHKGEMRSVIAKAYQRVVEKGKISLFKSYKKEYAHGEQKRDFLYVKDTIDVVMHFFNQPQNNGIYNVGSGIARSWNDLAEALFRALEKKSHIEYIDMPEYLRPRYQYYTLADISKLRNSGFENTFTPLEDAVMDYIQYLKTNAHI